MNGAVDGAGGVVSPSVLLERLEIRGPRCGARRFPELDYELEVAALTATPAHDLPERGEDGREYVIDWSARDLQREETTVRPPSQGEGLRLHRPWLVTPTGWDAGGKGYNLK